MKKKFGSAKLKGSVLYTVISVLMVLIVFLLGTLALAATANNRAMNNYSSAQTQYTAKAAVEAIMSAMQNNEQIAWAAAAVDDENPLLTVDGVTFEDSSVGTVESAQIEYAGTKWVLEEDTESDDYGKMVPKTIVKISATVRQGRESSTVAAYVLRDTSPSAPTDGNNNGFVSTGGVQAGNHITAFGGSFFGFDAAYNTADITLSNQDYILQNANNIGYETDLQVNGNLKIQNQDFTLIVKEAGTGMTVWGDLETNQNIKVYSANARTDDYGHGDALKYTDIPYIYVEGGIITRNNVKIGDYNGAGHPDPNPVPLNIFCGYIDATGNDFHAIADIYCYDETKTTTFGSNTKPKLYNWITHVLQSNGSEERHQMSNFYTKGNLALDSVDTHFHGDVGVEGNLTINGTVTIDGDLTVGGSLIVNGTLTMKPGSTVSCDDIQNPGAIHHATIAALRPGVTTVVPGGNMVKSGYTEEVVNAEYKTHVWYPLWNTYVDRAWVKEEADGTETVMEVLWNNIVAVTQPDGSILYYWESDAARTNPVAPPTYSVFRDAANNIVEESEATEWVDTKYYDAAGVEIVTPPIFPEEYEKDVILGKALLDGHDNVEETKIITTVAEVLQSAKSPYQTLYEVPDTYKAEAEAADRTFNLNGTAHNMPGVISHEGGNNYTISGSCTMSSTTSNTKVTFKVPTGQEIWVVVTNWNTASGSAQWLLDDSHPDYRGTVNILLKGDVTFRPNPVNPITTANVEAALNSGEPFQIFTNDLLAIRNADDTLKYKSISEIGINIYSENAEHTLTITDGSGIIAANIKAPYLTYKAVGECGKQISNPAVYYNGYNVKDGSVVQKLGCIGCCIIKEYEGQNDWLLLFVGNSGGDGGDGFDDAIMKNWQILYYENY